MLLAVIFCPLGWISVASGLECWESLLSVGHTTNTNETENRNTQPRKLISCNEGEVCFSQFTQFQNGTWVSKEFKQGCKKVEQENLNICKCSNGTQHSDKIHDRTCTCASSQCSDVALDYRNRQFNCSAGFIIPDPQKTDVCRSGLQCWESHLTVGHSTHTNETENRVASPRKLVSCKEEQVCFSEFGQFKNETWVSKEFRQGCKKVEKENLNICTCNNGTQHSDQVHNRTCTCASSQCSDVALDYRNRYFDCSDEFTIPDPQKTDVCPTKPVQCYQSSTMNTIGQTPRKEEIATKHEMVTCPANHVCAATFHYYSSPYFNQSFAKRECMPSPNTGSLCSCSSGSKHDPAKNITERTCLCTTTECSKPAEWYFVHYNRSDVVAGLTEPTDSTVCVAEPPTTGHGTVGHNTSWTSSPEGVTSTAGPTTSEVPHSTTEHGSSTSEKPSTGTTVSPTTKRYSEIPTAKPTDASTIDYSTTSAPTSEPKNTTSAPTIQSTTSKPPCTDPPSPSPRGPSELDCSTTAMDEVYQAVCERRYGKGWVGAVHQVKTIMCLRLFPESESNSSYLQVTKFCEEQGERTFVIPMSNEKERQLAMCQVNRELEKEESYKKGDYYFYLGAVRKPEGTYLWEYDHKPVENNNILLRNSTDSDCLAVKVSSNNRKGTWVRLSCNGEGEQVGAVCARPLIPK